METGVTHIFYSPDLLSPANPEVWESLKREFNEPFNQQYIRNQITECRKYNLNIEDRMIVVPVPFFHRRSSYVTAC